MLGYDLAGIGSRSAALLVDLAIQLVAIVVGLVALGLTQHFISQLVGTARLATMVEGALVLIVLFAVLLGYGIVFEIAWRGQTPGKRLLGLRVIRENGYPIRPTDAATRNILRLVDFLPFLYIAGLVTMLLNGRAKRLGDFAAGTVVVREGARASTAAFTSAVWGGESPRPRLEAADEQLVRAFLGRRAQMAPSARASLARRLAEAVAARNGLQQLLDDAGSDEIFLERLG